MDFKNKNKNNQNRRITNSQITIYIRPTLVWTLMGMGSMSLIWNFIKKIFSSKIAFEKLRLGQLLNFLDP
jgi:hypothetical protein